MAEPGKEESGPSFTSAAGSNDTVPDVLTYTCNPDGHEGDFGRLEPLTYAAKYAFDQVAARMERELKWAPNARRFIRYERSSAAHPQVAHGYAGYYRLNMDIPPRSRELQWVAGRDPNQADLLLADPDDASFMISSAHCIISHAEVTGALMIRATIGREVVVNGTEILPSEGRHMLTPITGIQLGLLSYVYRRTDLPESQYSEQLTRLREDRGWETLELPPMLAPTPQREAHVYQGFVIDAAVAGGAHGSVGYGWRCSTGTVVAAKRVVLKPRQVHNAMSEISMLRRMNHSNIVRLADGYDPEKAVSYHHHNGLLDIYILMEPVSPRRIADYSHDMLGSLATLTYLRDTLSALHYLTLQGIMHRDISAANIGIWIEKPRAVILDLGSAVATLSDSETHVGTLRYLAPEIMALRRGESHSPFGPQAELWSLGIVMAEYALARRYSLSANHGDGGIVWDMCSSLMVDLDRLKTDAGDSILRQVAEIVSQMLTWDKNKRAICATVLTRAEELLSAFQQKQAPVTSAVEPPPRKKTKK